MAKSTAKSAPRSPMTPAAAARIQSTTARANGGKVVSDSFAARALSAAAHNASAGGKGTGNQ